MRLMNMKPSTFLVGEKRLNPEALFIPATGVLGVRHSTDQIQRLVIPLGPTTEHHHWTICLSGKLHRAQISVGGGWHSIKHAVPFWNPQPRVPKEAASRCYAYP